MGSEITENKGRVNFKVYQPKKRKPYQNYHANLIKPWKEREAFTVGRTVHEHSNTKIQK